MRMREVLVALVDEAKILHWDAASAVWQHQPGECRTCRAAIDAQTALTVDFLDFQKGDTVKIGPGFAFGIVEYVATSINVRLGQATANGVEVYQGGPVGQFDASVLKRVEFVK